jgi:hypothetical protein
MSALVQQASAADFRHAEGPEIAEVLQKIGFGTRDTENVLKDLCEFRFIHTEGHASPSLACSFYPSRLAGHVVRNLVADFTFIENLMMDTFIPSHARWEELRSLTQSIEAERDMLKRINLRLARVKSFYECMAELYEPLLTESQRRGLAPEWCFSLYGEMRPSLEANLKRVLESAKKNYRRDKPLNEDELMED